MSKHSEHGGPPQYIHLRASYEMPEHRVRGQRRSLLGACCSGAIKAMLIALLPVVLAVGYLDYRANGWDRFAHELVAHWEFIAVPLAVAGGIGAIVGLFRR